MVIAQSEKWNTMISKNLYYFVIQKKIFMFDWKMSLEKNYSV